MVYPDCRSEYIAAFAEGIRLGGDPGVTIYSPFATWLKRDIVRYGTNIKAPIRLSWSCYRGGEKHCRKCSTCFERIEAFELAGVIDLTEYEEEK